MSKKSKVLTLAALTLGAMNPYGSSYYRGKDLEGSAIYIPKRHKYKRRNKR